MIDMRPGDIIVVRGDSITAGSTGSSWYVPMVNTVRVAFTDSHTAGATPTKMGNKVFAVGPFDRGAPTFVGQGDPGYTTNSVLADLSTKIYPYNPTGVIIAIQTNDCDNNQVNNATFTSNVAAIRDGIWANCPRLRWLAWQECACFNESFWGTNPYDTTVGGLADKDAILRAQSVLGSGFDLIQTRTNSSGDGPWKTYELANNLAGLNNGFLTVDGRHLLPAGATWQSALFMQSVTIVLP